MSLIRVNGEAFKLSLESLEEDPFETKETLETLIKQTSVVLLAAGESKRFSQTIKSSGYALIIPPYGSACMRALKKP